MEDVKKLNFQTYGKNKMTQQLIDAAQAVIDRWKTPLWKDVPATGNYINALRDALEAARSTLTPPDTKGALDDTKEPFRWMAMFNDGTGQVFKTKSGAEVYAEKAWSKCEVFPIYRAALTRPSREKQLLEALKYAKTIIGHPDDAGMSIINQAIAESEGVLSGCSICYRWSSSLL